MMDRRDDYWETDFDDWRDAPSEVEDDLDIDVCVACGAYFGWSDHPAHKAGEQKCMPCIRGKPPRHEY